MISVSHSSAEQVAAALGKRLARLRLAQNRSKEALARQAGISVRTLRRLEAGGNSSLDTLIRLLQALGLHDQLNVLLPDPGIRPAERMARGWKEPQRASRKKKVQTNK